MSHTSFSKYGESWTQTRRFLKFMPHSSDLSLCQQHFKLEVINLFRDKIIIGDRRPKYVTLHNLRLSHLRR